MAKLQRKMFVAQSTLEAWVDSGYVEFDGAVVTLIQFNRSYDLEPAVRFLSVVDGPRESQLIGKVLGEKRILELEGEIMGDSVVFGDIAFEVRPGFIASLRRARARSPSTGLADDLSLPGGR